MPRKWSTPYWLQGSLRCLALTLALGFALPGLGQPAARAIDLPSQSLKASLEAIVTLYSIRIDASESLVAGKTAAAVQGDLDARAALRLALRDSGLAAVEADDGGYTLVPVQRASGREMEEVFVFGVKEPLTLQQITTSADVFTAERLERESLFRVDDVIQRTPNVTGSLANLTIRGIPRGNIAGAGEAPSRGATSNVYVDGAPASTTALEGNVFLSAWDVKQVEVLRGPQSSVQGRNALAGAVFVTTNSPSYDREARARLHLAERDTEQYAGMVSGPLIADQLAFRFTADYQATDGYVDDALSSEDVNHDESLTLRGKLLWEPERVAGLRSEWTVEYADTTQGGPSAVFGPGAANDPAFADFDWRELDSYDRPTNTDTDTWRFIGDIAYELAPSLTLRLLGTYEDTDSVREIGNIRDPSLFDFNRKSDGTAETYSGELQLIFDRGKWSGLAGAYYYEDSDELDLRGSSLLAGQAPFPVDPPDSQIRFSQVTEGETKNYAFFLNSRYAFNDKWTFSAGLRYDNESVDLRSAPVSNVAVIPEDCLITVPGVLVESPLPLATVNCLEAALLFSPPREDPQQELEFDAWLPSGSITYHVSEELSLFVSARRGYRAGGTYLQNNITDDLGVSVREFDPEYLDDYEAGLRYLSLDNRLRVNANLFYSLYEDQQVIVPGPSGEFFDSEILNAGNSRIYGLEMEADYQFTDELSLFANIGLLDAEFRDFPFGEEGTARENLKGSTMPQAPRFSGNIGLGYRHASGLFTDASLYYQSAVESDIANLDGSDFGPGLTERTGSFTLANIRMGYRFQQVSIAAYVTNLFDDETPQSINIGAVSRDDDTANFFSNPRYNITPPRTVGLIIETWL